MEGFGNDGMHYGAKPGIFKYAKELRGRETLSEKLLWEYLSRSPYNLKFRRQHPIDIFIADFYCHPIRLVIEIDGGYHLNKEVTELDAAREIELSEFGISILRLTDKEVVEDFQNCIEKIKLKVEELS